jgi:hypothetical protein
MNGLLMLTFAQDFLSTQENQKMYFCVDYLVTDFYLKQIKSS